MEKQQCEEDGEEGVWSGSQSLDSLLVKLEGHSSPRTLESSKVLLIGI